MPELPEVETVRRGLEPVLLQRRIIRVEQRRADLRQPFPERFAERLAGRRVERLARRAKYLIAHLDDGEALIVHLGMSGRLTVATRGQIGTYLYSSAAQAEHDHVVLHIEGGETVIYNDPRRFGLMTIVRQADLPNHPLMAELGIEPLDGDLDGARLAALAAGRRTNLKAFLLDQRIIAGLGNIYACEALHRAGLAPTRIAGTLAARGMRARERAARLAQAIRTVLDEAVMAGGSTLRDYQRADGSTGGFQDRFAVYEREGEPCLTAGCRGMVRRKIQAGRSTFYCPACQR